MSARIGILEVGHTPKALLGPYPSYAQMLAQWLQPLPATVTVFPVISDEKLPAVTDADLWVITGSRCAVYENHPWIPEVEQFIVAAKACGKVRMLGICFGHQLIAQALGGQVTKSDKGWGVGLHQYTTENSAGHWQALPDQLSLCAFHQDQVIIAPPESQVIARSDFCEYAGLWYPGFALTLQPHPEFSVDFERDLIRLRHRDGVFNKDTAELALASLKGTNNRLVLAGFFKEYWQAI